MNKFFLKLAIGVFALFATITGVQAQGPTQYSLSHYQSGNEAASWTFQQQDVLISGGIINIYRDGFGAPGSICAIELVSSLNLLDTNGFTIPKEFPVTSTKLLVDVGSVRTVWPVIFVQQKGDLGIFVSRVNFPSGISVPPGSLSRIQVRGNMNVHPNMLTGFMYARYTNIIPCTEGVSEVSSINFDAIKTITKQKIDLLLQKIGGMVKTRTINDSVATVSVKTGGVQQVVLCPRISGGGLQPSNMRLVTERGASLYPNTYSCFEISTDPMRKTTYWTLTTDSVALQNNTGNDTVSVDFTGFPEPQYRLADGAWNRVGLDDLPKPIVLTYE